MLKDHLYLPCFSLGGMNWEKLERCVNSRKTEHDENVAAYQIITEHLNSTVNILSIKLWFHYATKL